MKRTITALLLCAVFCAAVFAQTGDDFEITQNKQGTITITRYTGRIKDVVIPSTIEGIRVTEFEIGAFSGNKNITSVTIPNGITNIPGGDGWYDERGAFSGCTSLTGITIPSSVTIIGSSAFSGCTSLTSVTIPNSVTSLGNSVFNGCASLTNVTIPSSVKSIGNNVFSGCASLASVTIPGSVTSIGSSAFSGCTSLANITIPNSVTSIGSSVFSGCASLASVTIGNSVNNIANNSFNNCTSLASVTIPDSVKSIGDEAFDGCTGLTSVIIGNGVTSIRGWAFDGCTSLFSVTIGSGVTSIGSSAFRNCTSIAVITIAANKDYAGHFPNNFTSYYESQGKKAATYLWSGRLWRIGTAAEAAQLLKAALEAYTFLEGWAVMPEGEFAIQTANAPQGFDRGVWDLNQTPPIREGATLDVWANLGEDDHYYHFIPLGDDWYKIAFRQNGLVLDVVGGQNDNGVRIQAYRDNGSQAQRFRFRQTKNGLYKIYTYWGRTIHTQRSDAEDGVVHTWDDLPDNSGYKKNQLWRLVKP